MYFKPELSIDECIRWNANKLINQRTHRKLTKNGVPYKEFVKMCKRYSIVLDEEPVIRRPIIHFKNSLKKSITILCRNKFWDSNFGEMTDQMFLKI